MFNLIELDQVHVPLTLSMKSANPESGRSWAQILS